jgi:long-chain acyl-CoA synthetase
VVGADGRLTFGELESTTTRAASALPGVGVHRGDRVAILADNGPAFVQAFVAIIKAGAVAVPVNTRLSPDEISYILSDARPAALFTDRVVAPAPAGQERIQIGLGGDSTEVLRLDDLIADGTGSTPPWTGACDDCVISYTSGTTGKPKGAILTQANYILLNGFLNGLMWGLSDEDRQLVTTPLAQRTGLARMMNMICHGCTLVLPPKFDAAAASLSIESERVSFMTTVPTVARMMLPTMRSHPERFTSLRAMVLTGEACPPGLYNDLLAALPDLAVHSFYAMTEVGLVASMGPAELREHPGAAGRVQLGVETRLVDAAGQDVSLGEIGELWVRSGEPGRFLTMRGYYDRPESNAQVLRDGWMATGDLCRLDEAHYLHLVDRKKDMIVSGGFNVYSAEVELVIAELDGVRDVAVVGQPDDTYGEAVTAFVELEPGSTVTAEQVVDHCRSRIASYKKPRLVNFVDQLPRNSTGKVLKRQLGRTAPGPQPHNRE